MDSSKVVGGQFIVRYPFKVILLSKMVGVKEKDKSPERQESFFTSSLVNVGELCKVF